MDDHKTKWMVFMLKFLTCYAQEGDEFLDSIVTGDETWGFHQKHLTGKKTTMMKLLEVMMWFKGKAVDFYDSGIPKLVPRLNKYLDNAGNSVEK
jgi:hypothetical protein